MNDKCDAALNQGSALSQECLGSFFFFFEAQSKVGDVFLDVQGWEWNGDFSQRAEFQQWGRSTLPVPSVDVGLCFWSVQVSGEVRAVQDVGAWPQNREILRWNHEGIGVSDRSCSEGPGADGQKYIAVSQRVSVCWCTAWEMNGSAASGRHCQACDVANAEQVESRAIRKVPLDRIA